MTDLKELYLCGLPWREIARISGTPIGLHRDCTQARSLARSLSRDPARFPEGLVILHPDDEFVRYAGTGYFVSKQGRVYSSRDVGLRKCLHPLKPARDKGGYQEVILTTASGRVNKFVHRMVLEAFVGPCPEGFECAHLDGDPSNNRIDNLRWATPAENAMHKKLHGTQMCRAHPKSKAKLSVADVAQILTRLAAGEYGTALAREFGVRSQAIYDLRAQARGSEDV